MLSMQYMKLCIYTRQYNLCPEVGSMILLSPGIFVDVCDQADVCGLCNTLKSLSCP